MFSAVVHKNEEGLKNKELCYHYQCKRDINHAVHNVKRSSKRQRDSKKIKNEVLFPKKLRSAIQTFDSNQSLFCQCMSEEQDVQDIIQDAKDLELHLQNVH